MNVLKKTVKDFEQKISNTAASIAALKKQVEQLEAHKADLEASRAAILPLVPADEPEAAEDRPAPAAS